MLDDPRGVARRPIWADDPMAPLLDDHAMARAVLEAMEVAAVRERVGTPLHTELWRLVGTFFDDYFDGVHHPKEDDLLLPLLRGVGFAGPMSPAVRMQQEHEQMQPYRQHLHFAVAQRDPGALRATVRAFVALHRRHMALEELHVFPMARAVLAAVAQRELRFAFEALDRDTAKVQRAHARALVGSIVAMVAAAGQSD